MDCTFGERRLAPRCPGIRLRVELGGGRRSRGHGPLSSQGSIVRVNSDGQQAYAGAMGESMTGVPATAAMHFRNGAMAFTYMATTLLELVDEKKVRLDDKLARYFPSLPYADRISLRNLADMTSGYADYVYQPEVLKDVNLHPFRHWTSDELISIGVRKPMMFPPGTNFGYSHTNYVILGRVIEKVTGMPLAARATKIRHGPMRLAQTRSIDTPDIPARAARLQLRAARRPARAGRPCRSTKTRRSGIRRGPPARGPCKSAISPTWRNRWSWSQRARLLSKSSAAAQIVPHLVGFGHAVPKCDACRRLTAQFNYGLGVVLLGPWIVQIKSFSGCGGTVGYLPSRRLTIAVVTTYAPSAFDAEGNYPNASQHIFAEMAERLAPGTLPKLPIR